MTPEGLGCRLRSPAAGLTTVRYFLFFFLGFGANGFDINLLGDFRQRLVRFLFLFQRLFEQSGRFSLSEKSRVRANRAIARDFLIRNALSGSDACPTPYPSVHP